MPGVFECGCAIALRVQSTLATKAVHWVANREPKVAERFLREADAHAKRLRKACDHGDHGPQEKR